MSLSLYNSLSKKTELFVAKDATAVGLYTCGPTVYDYAHIGNFRAFIFADILKRTLIQNGYTVNHVMNLTDVDDKTIRDSQKSGKSLEEFTTFFADAFKADSESLNILAPKKYVRAVEHIPEMLELIEKLIQRGHAYLSDDGSVYFSVESDKEYGKLSNIPLSEKRENAGGRIKSDEYEKDSASDFALWKAWDSADGEVFWEPTALLGRKCVIGKGRPGWHIECSAMSMTYLGEAFDIHTGGVDLIFPHHENEIAQSECATGKKFVNYWLHSEWVLVDGKKMSKRDGSFITLSTVKDRGVDPAAFRLYTLSGQYRSRLNFTWDALLAAQTSLSRLRASIASDMEGYPNAEESIAVDENYRTRFLSALNDDINTPAALAILHELVHDKNVFPHVRARTALNFDEVLSLGLGKTEKIELPTEVILLMDKREKARSAKDWNLSDELRNKIEALGFKIKDTEKGPEVTKI